MWASQTSSLTVCRGWALPCPSLTPEQKMPWPSLKTFLRKRGILIRNPRWPGTAHLHPPSIPPPWRTAASSLLSAKDRTGGKPALSAASRRCRPGTAQSTLSLCSLTPDSNPLEQGPSRGSFHRFRCRWRSRQRAYLTQRLGVQAQAPVPGLITLYLPFKLASAELEKAPLWGNGAPPELTPLPGRHKGGAKARAGDKSFEVGSRAATLQGDTILRRRLA